MNNQPLETQESPKRKRKLLTNPESMWAECHLCQEPGNLENLIRHQLPIKNEVGVELYACYSYVYFCSENCRGLFGTK